MINQELKIATVLRIYYNKFYDIMSRLMSLLSGPNNNTHESNPIYNYKFPTSMYSNFNDNYFFCGYKYKKKNIDKLIFEGEELLNKIEICNNLAFPISFASEGVIPINFNVYSKRNSFKIIKSDKYSDKIKLQFVFDADYPCIVEVFYYALETFSHGNFVYSVKPNFGFKYSSNHSSGPDQVFEYDFDNLVAKGGDADYASHNEFIPLVVVISTIDESQKQQFVTHLSFDPKSDNLASSNVHIIVQKLVYKQICFLIQEMYGADPLLEPVTLKSNSNSIKRSSLTLEEMQSHLKSKSDKNHLLIQDCVICMACVRDTLVLPCRHLCLCSSCGEKLLHQSPACPICRGTFRALLQIENLEKYLVNSLSD